MKKETVALLLTIRDGRPPWFAPDDESGIAGATDCDESGWIMCCNHVFSDAEIQAMEKAGWISTAGERDVFGRRQTTAGPALDAALLAAPAFDWADELESMEE